MKRAHILSMPLLVVGLLGAASASANDLFSTGKGSYPPVGEEVWRLDAPRAPSSTTRTQIKAELSQAQRLDQVSIGEEPWRFVGPPTAASNTRARVVAELREAERLGVVSVGGKHPIATPEQERLVTLAGVRALGEPAMAMR